MLDPTIQGGGGVRLDTPVPQNAKMNLRKSPMDMNTNRNAKLMQVSSQVAKRASSDGATIKQYQSAYRQNTKTTVTETYANFADKPKPTQYQGTDVAAEEAGTDGTTNVQCRSIDYDNMKTTVMKLPTDFVKFTEPTLSRVSPVVAKMAHTDGTRVMQYQSDDQNSMKKTNMQMAMDYLEIPEPALPWGFLELAEEARNVKVESGQSCYTEEVQSQRAGLTRPVFVTAMEYSSHVLKKGATRAAGISTEMIPTNLSAGRREPVDQVGLVGPQDKTEQSVLPGSDADEVGTVPTGPVGPDVTVDQIQPVAEGPIDQYITRSPVGSDRMLSTCDPDRPVANGPVGQLFILGPVGPRRMFFQYELNQPVAVGPLGQPFTTGPVGTHEMISNCKWMDRIADSPVGSTEIPDPVEETESPIQTDFMKIVKIHEPASLGDTPPSSDSGVYSLGEQWENMSTSTIDMESEQNERPINGSPMGRRGSDTRVPPNTEENEDINYPWTDCLLKEESDEPSSINIPNNRKDIQYNYGTICERENSSVNSGTDGGISDIGVLADFSDDEEESEVEQFSGCRIPGCQCEGCIEYMEWGSDDMTETDDSVYEDPDERANRLYVESYNYDLSEGMTPETYTPPLRKNRRRRYEVRKRKEPEIEEFISGTSDRGFQTVKESPNSEPIVQTRMVADEDIPTVRATGSDKDISSDEGSKLFDRPVTESATAWAGRNSHCPSDEYEKNIFGRLVTEAMTARTGNDANISSDEIQICTDCSGSG